MHVYLDGRSSLRVKPKRGSPRPQMPLSERVCGTWNCDEDAALCAVVAVHGAGNWGDIAHMVAGRDGKQCRERWTNHLQPGLNRKPFTESDDARLWEAIEEHGYRWAVISQLALTDRSDGQLKNRYNVLAKRMPPRALTPSPEPKKRRRAPLPTLVDSLASRELVALLVEGGVPCNLPPLDLVHLDLTPVDLAPADLPITLPPVLPLVKLQSPARAPLPPGATTTRKLVAVLQGSPLGTTRTMASSGPFDAINLSLRRFADARSDAWDGLPRHFAPL